MNLNILEFTNKMIGKIIFILFFSKKNFTKPKQKKILIIDKDLSEYILKYFNKKNIGTVNTRFLVKKNKKNNLYIFLKMILNFKFSMQGYVEDYIKCTNPKILITLIDNNELFYKFKNKFPKIKTIIIQFAQRTLQSTDIFSRLKWLKKQKFYCDYIFCYNNEVGKIYRSFLKGEIVSIGSFRF